MRFVNISNHNVNMAHVRNYHFTNDGWLNLTYSDGEQGCFRVGSGDHLREELIGARHIVQLVPCNAPLWVVWPVDDEGGKYEKSHVAERVLFFGLCANGDINPIGSIDGWFDIADGTFRLCTEGELPQFKNLTRLNFLNPMEQAQTVDPWEVNN